MAKRLVLLQLYGSLQVQEYEPAGPTSSQIQVKNETTSLNHLDWKRVAKNLFIPSFPHVLGMDIAGTVVDAGSSQALRVGDHIIAPGKVGYNDGCSFQTHVLVDENDCARISSSIPFSAASTLPFCLATAACALYLNLGLSTSPENRPTSDSKSPVLIWTLSDAKYRGSDFVFADDDPEVVSKIRAATPQLQYAFDTVVTDETVNKVAQCLPESGTIATAIKYTGKPPENTHLNSVFNGVIFGKTMTGQEFPAGRELGKWLWSNLAQWLDEGKITPLEYEEIGGLADIETGLNRMKTGNAKRKLVAQIT